MGVVLVSALGSKNVWVKVQHGMLSMSIVRISEVSNGLVLNPFLGACLLFGGCPLLGGSTMRGSTVEHRSKIETQLLCCICLNDIRL